MKNTLLLIAIVFVSFNLHAQKKYKSMMNDLSINFYEVCEEAEKYFERHAKGKGSGWKGYQRWRNSNEYKYYPDGVRSNVDPYFVEKAFKAFKSKGTSNDKNLFGTGWNELGPFRIDSVSGAYSTGLGRVEDHYVDPSNPNKMYLGSRSGGFWKTTDGGSTWQGGSTDFLTASGVNTIAVSPTNSDSILINVRNSRNGNSHGLYRSVDGGNIWNLSNFNPTNIGFGGLGSSFKIYEVRYHPRVPNLIFIGTSKGIYRSDDNLVTWTLLLTSGDIEEIQFHPTNNNIIYLYDSYYWGANKNCVMRSVDQGLSYNQSSQIIANADNRSVHLSVSNDCNGCLYFASDNGIWKSIDDGINFTFLSNPNQGCGGFAVNDLDTTKMIYGYLDVEASTNGGFNFNQVTSWSLGNTNGAGSGNQTSFNTSTDYVHADLHPAKCVNGVFYIGTDGLFCKSSDNGVTWEVLSQGVAIRENYKLGVSQSNHFRSISGSQDNGTSIKHQNTWIEFYGADGMEGLIHPLNDDWMIGSLQYGGRRQTKDGGITQGGISPSGQSGSGDGGWEAPIAYDPNNQMSIYNFGTAIFKSENFGSSWVSVGVPSIITGTISQAAIAENNSDIIVISKGSDIEKSIDGGASFVTIKNNLPSYSIEDIAFDPNNDDVIIVVYGRYQNDNQKIYMTTNGGTSWANITYNLGNMPIRSVVIDHTNASNIYIGAEIGVYTKPMSSSSWVLYNSDLPNTTIEELEIVYGSNTVKAATWGRGLWEYVLVGRNTYPAIITTKITDQPTDEVPKVGIDQYVTSTISYDNTLTSVYVEWSANTPTFGNVISMSNTIDSTWVSDSALPNQGIGTKMFFKVFAVGNSGDTTETYKFMYTVKQNCISSGTMQYQGNINLVNFNTINNATGKTAPYSDYYITDTTKVTVGQSYDLFVRLNTDNGNYTYHSTAWIDWNNDGDFVDPNETYQLGSVQNDSNALTSLSPLSISVPANAFIGKIRMRVVCLYNQVQTNPCATGFDGEVEDYGLEIQALPTSVSEKEIPLAKIFPNPTADIFTVKLNKHISTIKIELINFLGQTISLKNVENTNEIKVDIAGYAKGVYFMNLYLDEEKSVFKIIKK
ncbi:MAG: T9SS type A sorting domain-containing protein [Flavobacteriales bacterium]|nr:T9SS type A sorting domain-containing protein [Flavobacteriales bacterium]